MDQCLQETSGSGELGKLSLGEDEAAYICNYKYTKCVVSIISSKWRRHDIIHVYLMIYWNSIHSAHRLKCFPRINPFSDPGARTPVSVSICGPPEQWWKCPRAPKYASSMWKSPKQMNTLLYVWSSAAWICRAGLSIAKSLWTTTKSLSTFLSNPLRWS